MILPVIHHSGIRRAFDVVAVLALLSAFLPLKLMKAADD